MLGLFTAWIPDKINELVFLYEVCDRDTEGSGPQDIEICGIRLILPEQ